jgi:hypothetical protein
MRQLHRYIGNKKVELELANIKDRMAFAFSAGNIAIWDYFPEKGSVITNPVFNAWVKQTPMHSEGELSWLISLYPPPRHWHALQKLLRP